ncbi:MAG: helix-hairpin-helix domain-containing protein [Lachnospiraceae bacterium]
MHKKYDKLVLVLLLCMLLTACVDTGNLSLQEALSSESDSSATLSTNSADEVVLTEDVIATTEALEQVVCYVYVCGAVVSPGVYELLEGERKVQAIELAGGFLEEAAQEAINLAEEIEDGMQIVVPTVEELDVIRLEEELVLSGLINLNTASKEQLCTLSGIGDAKATEILAYREQIGTFSSIEELKNISGIGDSVYDGIKDFIYVDG